MMTRKTIDDRYDIGLMIGTALLLFLIALAYFAWTVHAFGQDAPLGPPIPVAVPDEQTKVCALKRAYELNGGSMVGNGYMIDVSKEDLSKCLNPPAAALEPKKPVKKAKATK